MTRKDGEPYEPTGVSLKAAYLLLRELKRYPQLPGVEQMACILDDVLNYKWAIRIIRIEDGMQGGLRFRDENDGVGQFNEWADSVLIGPDFRNAPEPGGDIYPAPPHEQPKAAA